MTTARILRDAGFLGAGNHRRTNNINDTTINDTMKNTNEQLKESILSNWDSLPEHVQDEIAKILDL